MGQRLSGVADERKLKAGHGLCLRKFHAQRSIPLICGDGRNSDFLILTSRLGFILGKIVERVPRP
jgi:hypothetical protein